jgi:hypothetical protein
VGQAAKPVAILLTIESIVQTAPSARRVVAEQPAHVHLAPHHHHQHRRQHPHQHHHRHLPVPLAVLGQVALRSVVIAALRPQEVILRAVVQHLAQVLLRQLQALPLGLLRQLQLLGHVQAPLLRIRWESARMLSARTIISSSLVIGVFHAHRGRGPMLLVGVSKRWQT